jgi:hypothetical protein
MRNIPKILFALFFCSAVLLSLIFSQEKSTATTVAAAVSPDTYSATEGQQVEMTVVAEGNIPMTFQWYKKGLVDILVSTGPTYTIQNAKVSDTGLYYVSATNSVGVGQSNVVTLNVAAAPTVTNPPSFIYIEARDDIRPTSS